MRISINAILESLFILCVSILWCEFGYYYYTFRYKCHGWPEPGDMTSQQEFTRIMVISDTHIMGPLRSFLFDKWRREWEMKQAFSFAASIYEPDVVVFLGDIFDEGSFSSDDLFDKAKSDFEKIFPHHLNKHKRIIIPGNHDVGNHDQMTAFPYLIHRFHVAFGSTTNVELLDSRGLKGLNIISINSMTFYNDSCPYCSQSIAYVNRIALKLDELRANPDFSEPILLIHIPLYRKDDSQCDHPSSISNRVKEENIEGKDVIHKSASSFLLSRLKPRLILSGHTHMDCVTFHKSPNDSNEITVSSFNHKYAENKPSLLLLSVNRNNTFTKHCPLIDEWMIAIIYTSVVVIIIWRLSRPLSSIDNSFHHNTKRKRKGIKYKRGC